MEEITLQHFIFLVQAELEEAQIYNVSDLEIEECYNDGLDVEETVEKLSSTELDLNEY